MNVADLILDIYKTFRNSSYPRMPFDYCAPGVVALHVRIPPAVPENVRARYRDIRHQVKAAPAIERIEISEELRRQGIFRSLVETLLEIEFVESVCISDVRNESFRQYFLASDCWRELVLPQIPRSVIAPRNFYTTRRLII